MLLAAQSTWAGYNCCQLSTPVSPDYGCQHKVQTSLIGSTLSPLCQWTTNGCKSTEGGLECFVSASALFGKTKASAPQVLRETAVLCRSVPSHAWLPPGTSVTDLLQNGVLGRCLIPTATSICLRPLSPWAIPLLRNPGALSARGKADTDCPSLHYEVGDRTRRFICCRGGCPP